MPGMGSSKVIDQPGPRPAASRREARHRGQSIVEFAIVLPVMLAIGGVLIDAARLYQVWTNLEAATRDAAQYLATSSDDPYSGDYTWAGENADNKAGYILTTATGYAVERAVTTDELAACAAPVVTTTYAQDVTSTNGGSVANPASTATVVVCIPFHTLFAYPFLTTDGAFMLRTERTMTVLVGR